MRESGEEVFATLPATGVVAMSPSHLHPVHGVHPSAHLSRPLTKFDLKPSRL